MEFWTRPAKADLSRLELVDMKVHNTLFTTFYVQIVSLMKEKYGVEGAKDALREIGEGVATTMWKYRKPKAQALKPMIEDLVDFAFYYTVEFKDLDVGLVIVDKNCPICWEGVVEKDIPYCCIIDGFLEKYVCMASDDGYPVPRIQSRAVKSKATGDPHCEHLITIL
jgi:predicted hydrocarbon binding protein